LSANLWPSILDCLQHSLDPEDFQVWISPLRVVQNNGAGLALICPNAFHLKWIREHYLSKINTLLAEMGTPVEVRLDLDQTSAPKAEQKPRQMGLPKVNDFSPVFNRRFVFDGFVTGACNEFAAAAARAMARGQRMLTNTLFLFSSTGLGKSHLTQAVGQHVLGSDPGQRVAYLTAEDFANRMISALRKKRIQEFKDRFRRSCDVLLLEEVQFLAGKDKIQEELGYTLDALLDADKRVIFTGSCLPTRIKGIKSGLASRLAAGVTVPIDPPDHSTRLGILKRLAQEEQTPVDSEVLEYLAQEATGDVRQLQSTLVGLIAKASFTGRTIDLRMAGEMLGQMASRPVSLTPERVLEVLAKVYGLEPKNIVGKSRAKAITRTRNMGMYLCRRHTEASYASIGKVFNRDHSTVMYGVGQVERGLLKDGKLNQEVAFLEQRLGVPEA
jgi:chromosomal replication initiator protein